MEGTLDCLETVNDPGQPGRTGDDRFGYDLGAGTAWVLDGASDVSDLRPFPQAESGAAWIAEALSARLLTAPAPDQGAGAYFTAVLEDVRAAAARESAIALDALPGEAAPIAAGIWMQLTGPGRARLCWLGDCMAIISGRPGEAELIGTPEKAEDETQAARTLLAMSPEDRLEALRAARRAQNTPGRAIFGLDPDAAQHLERREVRLDTGADILLMSDGFFRLVSPYREMTPTGLIDTVREHGLIGALQRLRALEGADADNARLGRIKTRDDACALWLRHE